MIRDRLYGEIDLPPLVERLALTCPALLRLREIRMANIPFLTYPSFADVSRYEHSVGVAHLAWRWARRHRLNEDLGTALTLVAIYHDAGTPAFGHLFEEILSRDGFDHETVLPALLSGSPSDAPLPGGKWAQVFAGEYCKLADCLPRPKSADSPLVLSHLADLITGSNPLGQLVAGNLDLDNIDNVIRATTAMGLINPRDAVHPYSIVDSLIFENGVVQLTPNGRFEAQRWAHARRLLYSSILENVHEFAAQTAIKWAIELAAREEPTLGQQESWKLTEPELIYQHLHRYPDSRRLVNLVRLGRPPALLFSAWVDDIAPLIGAGSDQTIAELSARIGRLANVRAYVNFYMDKRERPLPRMGPTDMLDLWHGAEPPVVRGTSGGIIGAIQLHRDALPRAVDDPSGSSAPRPLDLDAASNVCGMVLGNPPRLISTQWLATRIQRPRATVELSLPYDATVST